MVLDNKGVIVIERGDIDEDTMMMDAIESGASDIEIEEETYIIFTDPNEFSTVREALEKLDYSFVSAQVEMVPQNYVKLENEESIKNMEKLIDMLEDNDDVQQIWHNWEDA